MWLFLNDCFLSVVEKDCARDELLVRARRKGDIEKIFPHARVKRGTTTDYLYRAVVKRAEFEKAIVLESRRITYPNFKDSMPKEERAYHDACVRVWGVMSGLQETRPFTGQPTFNFSAPRPKLRGSAGGKALAAKRTASQRSEAARNAANARWGNNRRGQ